MIFSDLFYLFLFVMFSAGLSFGGKILLEKELEDSLGSCGAVKKAVNI